jgi:hypothetical protein
MSPNWRSKDKMINIRRPLSLLFLVFPILLSAQSEDTLGAYCSVFYITSFDQNELPFEDNCFVTEEYSISNPKDFKTIGPIIGSISLFKRYDWLMHFYLPIPAANQRLQAMIPDDILAKGHEMEAGKFFITISDNRNSSRFDPILDNVDFALVGGNAKVLEFEPMEGSMKYAEYKLQMDLRFKKVDYSSGKAVLIGNPFRVKMVVVIEGKD